MLDRKVWALPAFPLPLIHIYIDKIVHSPLFFLSVFKCIFLKKKKKRQVTCSHVHYTRYDNPLIKELQHRTEIVVKRNTYFYFMDFFFVACIKCLCKQVCLVPVEPRRGCQIS